MFNFYLKNNIGNNRFTNGAQVAFAIIADLNILGLVGLPNFASFNIQLQPLSKPERFQAFMDLMDQPFTALHTRHWSERVYLVRCLSNLLNHNDSNEIDDMGKSDYRTMYIRQKQR